MVQLPANDPYQMYTAVAGGQQCWQDGVRPPTYCPLHEADQAAVSVLRAVAGWHDLPSAQFFQPLRAGWVGVDPPVVVTIHHFLQGYYRQLRHANVMVRHSTQHDLYQAMQRYHPDMPCVRKGLVRYCRVHNTDHDRFVHYTHVLGFSIALPPIPREQGSSHTMCHAQHPWQTVAIHEWMDAGYFTLQDAHAASSPLGSWQWELEKSSPWYGVAIPLQPELPSVTTLPRNAAFVTDGSWFPTHRCGGAFGVVYWILRPGPCTLSCAYLVPSRSFVRC